MRLTAAGATTSHGAATPPSASDWTYRPEFDGLRAIAVLAVMAGHLPMLGAGADFSALSQPTAAPFLRGGLLGVDIFFVLSGFLITSLLLREHARWGAIDLRAFYIRRALRLGPALCLLLTGLSLYLVCVGGRYGQFGWQAVFFSAFHISSFAMVFAGPTLGILSPTWSLSVEEQFYLAWPWIMSRMLAMGRRAVLRFMLGAILLTWLLRAALFFLFMTFYLWPLFTAANHLILTRADGLLCGAMLAMAAHWGWLDKLATRQRRAQALGLLSVVALLAILVAGAPPEASSIGLVKLSLQSALVTLATTALLAAMLAAPSSATARILSFPLLTAVGKISYGLYLFHLPIFALLPAYMIAPGVAEAFALETTFVIAAISYIGIEKPILALRGVYGLHRKAAVGQPRTAQGDEVKPVAT